MADRQELEYCCVCGILCGAPLDDRAVLCPAEDGWLCGEDCLAEHMGNRLDDDDGTNRDAHRRNLYRVLHLFEAIRRGP